MITIAEIQSARYTATGDQIIRAVLFADTVADLPASPTAITGYILTQGSTCRVIADSTLYMMQSSGTWIQQLDDITADTYTRQQIDAMIAQQAADLVAAQTTLQADIDRRLRFTLGTAITDPDPDQGVYADLFTLAPGQYYRQTNILNVLNRPAGLTTAFYCTVINTISSARRRIMVYSAGASAAGTYYTALETGTPAAYGAWYRFDGTQI